MSLNIPFAARLLATLAAAAAIIAASTVPGTPKPGDAAFVWLVYATPTGLQKSLHVVAYGVLAVLTLWTLQERVASGSVRILAVVLSTLVLGALLEWYQTTVPGRFGSLTDVLLNGAGILLGVLVARWLPGLTGDAVRPPGSRGSPPSSIP